MRFLNFFLNHMVQKYQNEIAPIFYYGISTKTNEKDLQIPNFQPPYWKSPYWMTLYIHNTYIFNWWCKYQKILISHTRYNQFTPFYPHQAEGDDGKVVRGGYFNIYKLYKLSLQVITITAITSHSSRTSTHPTTWVKYQTKNILLETRHSTVEQLLY